MIAGDQVVRHSDALLGAFGPDGDCDGEAFDAAAAASFDAKCGSAVLLSWTYVLAATHERGDKPLEPPLDQLAGRVEDTVRDVVRRHGRALINTARLGDDDGVQRRWLTILDVVDDDGLGWLCWTMAAATAPVMRTLGGLDRHLAAVEVVQQAVRRSDVPHNDIRAIAAALCAVAAGEHDAGLRYMSLPDVDNTLRILIALIPRLLRGRRTKILTTDQAGIPSGFADPIDAHAQRLNAVVTAATAGDPARAAAAIKTAVPADDPSDILHLLWNLTTSLGSRLGQMFVNYEHTRVT